LIHVDASLNNAEKIAAIKAALKAAGYADANVDLANSKATVVTGGLEKTFTFFSYNETSGTYARYCANDGIDAVFYFGSDAIVSGEMTYVLYSGENALAEAVFVPKAENEIDDGFSGYRAMCFYVNMTHDSGNWDGNNFKPHAELKPTTVVAYINGVEYASVAVQCTDPQWAELIALDGVHVGCSDAECQ